MNPPEARMTVEVVYALPDCQWCWTVSIPEGGSVAMAVAASGWPQQFPDIPLSADCVGVFGRVTGLQHSLRAGDRVEIYRPLLIDPKEQRRQRAQRR